MGNVVGATEEGSHWLESCETWWRKQLNHGICQGSSTCNRPGAVRHGKDRASHVARAPSEPCSASDQPSCDTPALQCSVAMWVHTAVRESVSSSCRRKAPKVERSRVACALMGSARKRELKQLQRRVRGELAQEPGVCGHSCRISSTSRRGAGSALEAFLPAGHRGWTHESQLLQQVLSLVCVCVRCPWPPRVRHAPEPAAKSPVC